MLQVSEGDICLSGGTLAFRTQSQLQSSCKRVNESLVEDDAKLIPYLKIGRTYSSSSNRLNSLDPNHYGSTSSISGDEKDGH